jgi:alcohol dehydrogenase class IV
MDVAEELDRIGARQVVVVVHPADRHQLCPLLDVIGQKVMAVIDGVTGPVTPADLFAADEVAVTCEADAAVALGGRTAADLVESLTRVSGLPGVALVDQYAVLS